MEPRTFEEALDACLAHCRAVMIERQQKYGPENITLFGLQGIVVRAGDKLMRLKRAVFTGQGLHATDESVDDTLTDLTNYGLIGQMLRQGIWGLPLEEDARRGTDTG